MRGGGIVFLRDILITLLLCALLIGAVRLSAQETTPTVAVPPVPREFRAVWVATVDNIDWPSRRGLSVDQQKAELIRILDKAVQLHLNAVILQVRPACDAFYRSSIEPWSIYLTGHQGEDPSYDPLAFAIEEAHKRGLQLHAWFNPFRAYHPSAHGPLAPNHVAHTHPEWVRHYGDMLWLDPGDPQARAYSLSVILDVVRRYDIDGVAIDDYFYPYPISDKNGHEIPFPDQTTYHRYRQQGGTLDLADWRRQNINDFVEKLYEEVKAIKPWVLVGISPFGIWRPGHPEQIQGFDAYNEISCDSRLWLRKGWLDYLSPQLYWPIEKKAQCYSVLLNWWLDQCNSDAPRYVWPSLYTGRVGDGAWPASEIVHQIEIAEKNPTSDGCVQFSMKTLMANQTLSDALVNGPYAQPALVPSCPWLGGSQPDKPSVEVEAPPSDHSVTLRWYEGSSSQANLVQVWVLQMRLQGAWQIRILPADCHTITFASDAKQLPDVVAISAINNYNLQSVPAVIYTPQRVADKNEPSHATR